MGEMGERGGETNILSAYFVFASNPLHLAKHVNSANVIPFVRT